MRILRQKIAGVKPKLYYGTTTEWVFDFPNDLPSGVYTMVLDVDRDSASAPVALATAEPVGRTLTFAVDTFNDACEAAALARKLLYLEVYRDRDTPVVDDRLRILPRTDVAGIPPGRREEYPKKSEVEKMISDALASDDGGEGSSWSDQLAGYREPHAVYGEVIRLDNLFQVKCYGRAYKIAKLRLAVVTADPAVTGNAVLIPVIAGVDGAPVVAPVGATPSEVIFDFSPVASGLITIRRDTGNALDTLKSGNIVSVLVLAVQKMVAQ